MVRSCPQLASLLDGTMVFTDSEEWRHFTEARHIAHMDQHARSAWLFDLERIRGVEATERLRKTIDEVISVTATGASS